MKYKSIDFRQGEAADEALDCLEKFGLEACIQFMLDNKLDEVNYEEDEYLETVDAREGLGEGTRDNLGYSKRMHGYVLVWNERIGYIGLSKEVPDEQEAE